MYLVLQDKGVKCTIYTDTISLAIEVTCHHHHSIHELKRLVLTSSQARFEMPMDWRRAEGGGLAICVIVKKTECPGAHGDVTIALRGDNRGGRKHGDVRLILAVLNSYRIYTWLKNTSRDSSKKLTFLWDHSCN